MAKGFNKVTLLGNLTRDPEMRTTSGGQNVTNFGLAINRSWRNAAGEQQEDVDYIDCVAWGKAGEIINQYMQKGRALLVSGRLSQRSWEADDGSKRSKVEVVVEDFNFISDGGNSDYGDSGSSSAPAPSTEKPAKKTEKKTKDVVIEDIDDSPVDLSDIPF